MSAVVDYFRLLGRSFAEGWNRFWFTPSDPYPLGVIRLLTGALAVFWQLSLLPDVGRFYGARGWLPLEAVERVTLRGYVLSYLDNFTSQSDLFLVHLAGLAVLLLFALGWRTRLTSVLSLLVMLSNVHRAPMITSQFEPVLTMVTFYLCLGPAGASCSVDRWLARRRARAAAPASPAAATPQASFTATLCLRLIQIHLAALYATMGFSKLMGDTWWSGMGVWWLATRPESRLADLTAMHRYLVNFWSHAIVAFELGFPLLIWIRVARPLLLGLAVVHWTTFAVLTGQTMFALMMLVANLSFCSPAWLRSCASVCPCCRTEPAGAAN